MIELIKTNHLLHMRNDKVSYIVKIEQGYVFHVYFGDRLDYYEDEPDFAGYKRSYCTEHEGFERSFDELPFEMPQFGQGDFRQDALSLYDRNSQEDYFDFRFDHVEWLDELSKPKGMPGLKGKGKTMQIVLKESQGMVLRLNYGMFEDLAGIVRFQSLENHRGNDVEIRKLDSFSLELMPDNYEILTLYGTHLKEGGIQKSPILVGRTAFESRRGSSSSQHPPYAAITTSNTDWFHGETVGMAMLYSGSHIESIEKDVYGQLRVGQGIHPDTLHWDLGPDQTFDTPQCVLTWTKEGLNGMAHEFHHVCLEHLIPDLSSSILLNSWESLYYDITSEKIEALADQAAKTEMEMVVIDDGWFRLENNSRSPIGDWKVNKHKLSEGLDGAIASITKRGMKAGLWFEPEAVSANSQLAKKHPEWILRQNMDPVQGRHELLLDLSKQAVQDHLIEMLDFYLSNYDLSYIKWDMNRPLTDTGRNGKGHAYVLGLYRVLETIRQKHPSCLIEGCSSGGNRLDLGMLAYVAQNWTSDNTDPFDRREIQSGLSLFLPPQKITAHVSAQENHQTGRRSSWENRFGVARFFNPGFEVDLALLNEKETDIIKEQVATIKEERNWLEVADFYQDDGMWYKIDKKKEKAMVQIFQEHFDPRNALKRYRIHDLKPDVWYCCKETGVSMSGEQLEKIGFRIRLEREDFHVYTLEWCICK